MSDAPTELWADWDYDANDGVCGVHTHKKYASGYEPDCPPIRYVRADHVEELEAKLAKAVEVADQVIDAIHLVQTYEQPDDPWAENALTMCEHEVFDFDVKSARTTLAELKGQNDE